MLKKISESKSHAVLRTEDDMTQITIKYPQVDLDIFNHLREMSHKTLVKNDIYETASVETEFECDIESQSGNLGYSRPCWRYVCESYKEYLASAVQENNCTDNEKVIFEDDNYVISTLESKNLVKWHCTFKSPDIHSIRELKDTNELKKLREKIYELVAEVPLNKEDVCMYFDYIGKARHLTLYIVEITSTLALLNCSGKFIYFDTLINNLNINLQFYNGNVYYIQKYVEVVEF